MSSSAAAARAIRRVSSPRFTRFFCNGAFSTQQKVHMSPELSGEGQSEDHIRNTLNELKQLQYELQLKKSMLRDAEGLETQLKSKELKLMNYLEENAEWIDFENVKRECEETRDSSVKGGNETIKWSFLMFGAFIIGIVLNSQATVI